MHTNATQIAVRPSPLCIQRKEPLSRQQQAKRLRETFSAASRPYVSVLRLVDRPHSERNWRIRLGLLFRVSTATRPCVEPRRADKLNFEVLRLMGQKAGGLVSIHSMRVRARARACVMGCLCRIKLALFALAGFTTHSDSKMFWGYFWGYMQRCQHHKFQRFSVLYQHCD